MRPKAKTRAFSALVVLALLLLALAGAVVRSAQRAARLLARRDASPTAA